VELEAGLDARQASTPPSAAHKQESKSASHQPSVTLAEQHAVRRREADIDLITIAEHMGVDDRLAA
jgi:hypothetical protein